MTNWKSLFIWPLENSLFPFGQRELSHKPVKTFSLFGQIEFSPSLTNCNSLSLFIFLSITTLSLWPMITLHLFDQPETNIVSYQKISSHI